MDFFLPSDGIAPQERKANHLHQCSRSQTRLQDMNVEANLSIYGYTIIDGYAVVLIEQSILFGGQLRRFVQGMADEWDSHGVIRFLL